MRQLRRSLRIAGAGMALTLGLVACGNGDTTADETPATDTTPADDADTPTDADTGDDMTEADDTQAGPNSGAAALRATLTAALQEHVYLAGITVNEGVTNGLDSQEFELAAGALDANSKALADAIGSVYDGAGEPFLELWRNHIQFFVDYTAAKAAGDEEAAEQARADLDTYREDFGAFISGANPNLPADAVEEELVPHVNTVFDAIDALLGSGDDPFVALRDAAGVMPGTAATLAGGIATQFPDQFDGAADGPGADLRATLTAGLQEHVYLAGIAVVMGVRNGLDSAEFEAAAGALDANSVALSEAIESVYEGAGEPFLELWRNHIGFFVDYTAAKAAGDEEAAEQARADLDTYREDFGAFISGANPNLPADAVEEELVPHVNTLFDAIDAVLGNGEDPFAALQEAASVMPGTAETLAGGIAAQFPDQFGN